MQIILSDDHSTDATFSIIQEHAEAYSGPHSIFTNRTPYNLGTVDHFVELVPQMKGELIVLAAGDDVSLPDRAQALVDERQRTGAWGLMSHCNLINEHGEIVRHDVVMDFPPSNGLRAYFDHPVKLVGATGKSRSSGSRALLQSKLGVWPFAAPTIRNDKVDTNDSAEGRISTYP